MTVRNPRRALLSFALSIATVLPPGDAGAAQPGDGWRDLFNSRDLSGWKSSTGDTAAWGVRGGAIVSVSPGRGEWLHTIEEFADFEIVLEFFLPAGANTGLGLRTSSVGDPSFGGFEIQLNDAGGHEPTVRNAGAVFNIAPARVMAIRSDAWNTLHARVVGDRLDAWLNGERIHEGTALPRRVFDAGRPDAWRRGRIALQDNAGAAVFRAVRIRQIERAFGSPQRD